MTSFQDRVAVITGAASGIGRALSLQLLDAGAVVYACDLNEPALQEMAETSRDRLIPVRLDVTDQAAVEATLSGAMATHKRLDYVFNNAGIVVGGAFENMDEAAWKKIVNINFWGVVYGSQQAYRLMKEQGFGHIVNTASTAGVTPVALSTAYAATKHAVVGLSTSLREEGRAHGVKVSVAIPGLVDTNIFGSATNLKGHDYQAAVDKVPIGKISPEQAARAMLRGVRKNKPYIVFPGYNRFLVRAYRMAPDWMGRLINQAN